MVTESQVAVLSGLVDSLGRENQQLYRLARQRGAGRPENTHASEVYWGSQGARDLSGLPEVSSCDCPEGSQEGAAEPARLVTPAQPKHTAQPARSSSPHPSCPTDGPETEAEHVHVRAAPGLNPEMLRSLDARVPAAGGPGVGTPDVAAEGDEDGLLTELEYRARRDMDYGALVSLIQQNRRLLDELEAGILLDREAAIASHQVSSRASRATRERRAGSATSARRKGRVVRSGSRSWAK